MSDTTSFAIREVKHDSFIGLEHGLNCITVIIYNTAFQSLGSLWARGHTLYSHEARALAADLIRRADEIDKREKENPPL